MRAGLLVLMADSERYSLGSFLQVLVVRKPPKPLYEIDKTVYCSAAS